MPRAAWNRITARARFPNHRNAYARPGASLVFSLVASTGTYVLAGRTAVLAVALPALRADWSLTGRVALAAVGLVSSAGAYVLSGRTATFATLLPTVRGVYVLTGRAADLTDGLGGILSLFDIYHYWDE